MRLTLESGRQVIIVSGDPLEGCRQIESAARRRSYIGVGANIIEVASAGYFPRIGGDHPYLHDAVLHCELPEKEVIFAVAMPVSFGDLVDLAVLELRSLELKTESNPEGFLSGSDMGARLRQLLPYAAGLVPEWSPFTGFDEAAPHEALRWVSEDAAGPLSGLPSIIDYIQSGKFSQMDQAMQRINDRRLARVGRLDGDAVRPMLGL